MTQNQKKSEKNKYYLGNLLRGYLSGDFYTDEEAWNVLCSEFNEMYPTQEEDRGRTVHMYMEIQIKTGWSKLPFAEGGK